MFRNFYKYVVGVFCKCYFHTVESFAQNMQFYIVCAKNTNKRNSVVVCSPTKTVISTRHPIFLNFYFSKFITNS